MRYFSLAAQLRMPPTHKQVLRIEGAGSAIKQIRVKSGHTLQAAADRLRWHKSRLVKYENNRLGLSLAVIEELAGVYEVPPLVIAFRCLQHVYPALQSPRSKPRGILENLIKELTARR